MLPSEIPELPTGPPVRGFPTVWIFIGRTVLKLKLQYSGVKNWLIGKGPDAGKDWGQEENGMTEDEMIGWHHWRDGCEFEYAPGVDDGQGSLACCSPWGRRELDTTERLNWTELKLFKSRELLRSMIQIICLQSRENNWISLLESYSPNEFHKIDTLWTECENIDCDLIRYSNMQDLCIRWEGSLILWIWI